MRQVETRGNPKEGAGKLKEAVGILSGDGKPEKEGPLQRAEGAVQEGLGKARRKIGEALASLRKAVSGERAPGKARPCGSVPGEGPILPRIAMHRQEDAS